MATVTGMEAHAPMLLQREATDDHAFVLSLVKRQRALDDPDRIMRLTSEALGRWLRVRRVTFYRAVSEDQVEYLNGWTDATQAVMSGIVPVDYFGEWDADHLRHGRPAAFSDSRTDFGGVLASIAAHGTMSGVRMPLRTDGSPAGLVIGHSEARPWTAAELGMIAEVNELTWIAVGRAESLRQLQERVGRQDAQIDRGLSEIERQREGLQLAEQQVRQLQKMQAVGQLTSGIAHDFNNMLAVVVGALELAHLRLERGEGGVKRQVDVALDAALRAASLADRLLAFVHKQPVAAELVDPSRLVTEMTDLLAQSLGSRIRLVTSLASQRWSVFVDRNQLQSAVVNLAVNARDAMSDGGTLTVGIEDLVISPERAAVLDLPAGEYVVLSVKDTGTGMADDVLERAFEPFFTTKPPGQGTGLGLSQVSAFACDAGGHVRVDSKVGVGTRVCLYLPRAHGEAGQAQRAALPTPRRRGSPDEIVLVVEDDERMRAVFVEALVELGYGAVEAADGTAALALLDAGQPVSVLLTDILLPGMTGRELVARATDRQPGLGYVYTSGHVHETVVEGGVIEPGAPFLAKPFGFDALAEAIAAALARR